MATPSTPPSSSPAPLSLTASGLGKRFAIYPNDRSRFFEFLGSRVHHVEHWALRGVDFSVRRGEAFGVIGANGAGKSTLLKLLAGIVEPTTGAVQVQGRLATLLDLGAGFHTGFTGRENIHLTCALQGMRPEEIEARIPDIIRFAELSEFIDHPVRTYSTGMHLRLGFAIATHSSADVLVVDEVLAVGDQYFQRKCVRRIEALLAEGATLVLVSHDLHAVRSLCNEVLWLDQGRPRAQGSAREVVEQYLEQDRLRAAPARPKLAPVSAERPRPEGPATEGAPGAEASRPPVGLPSVAERAGRAAALPGRGGRTPTLPPHPYLESDPALLDMVQRAAEPPDAEALFGLHPGDAPHEVEGDVVAVAGTGEARIVRVQLLDVHGVERERFRSGESLVVAVTFRTTEPLADPIFGVALFRSDGTYVYGPNTRFDGVLSGTWHGVYTFFVHYPRLPLLAGGYRVSVAIFDAGHVSPHVWHNQLYGFTIVQDVEDHGLVQLPHHWGMVEWLSAPVPEGFTPPPRRRGP